MNYGMVSGKFTLHTIAKSQPGNVFKEGDECYFIVSALWKASEKLFVWGKGSGIIYDKTESITVYLNVLSALGYRIDPSSSILPFGFVGTATICLSNGQKVATYGFEIDFYRNPSRVVLLRVYFDPK
jgi:hypothetical protein